MAPLFSVIVPVFNGGKYLERAIASVLRQTLTEFELILVDDGSTDRAVERAGSITDSRMTILSQPNMGAPSALNRGIAAARGEYIALLDCDDIWAPAKLQRQLECFIAHPEADVAFTGLIYIDPDDQPLGLPCRTSEGSFNFERLLVDNVIGSSSAIAARRHAVEAVGGFDPAMLYIFDVDLVLRIARLRPNNIYGIPEPLTHYRRRPGQQTSDWRPMAAYWTKLMEKHRGLAPVETRLCEHRAQMNMTRYLSYLAYEEGDLSPACSLMRAAFESDPIAFLADLRNWRLGLACSSELLLPGLLYRWLAARAGLRHLCQRPRVS